MKLKYTTRINWLMIVTLAIAGFATAYPQYERESLIAVFVVMFLYLVVILRKPKT